MAIKQSEKQPAKSPAKVKGSKHEELHTDTPLSEKDEVKQAEQNTQKQQNKSR